MQLSINKPLTSCIHQCSCLFPPMRPLKAQGTLSGISLRPCSSSRCCACCDVRPCSGPSSEPLGASATEWSSERLRPSSLWLMKEKQTTKIEHIHKKIKACSTLGLIQRYEKFQIPILCPDSQFSTHPRVMQSVAGKRL